MTLSHDAPPATAGPLHHARRAALFTVLALASGACSDISDGGTAGRLAPTGGGPRLEEIIRLGSATADGPTLFGRIADVELGRRGEVFVLDQQAAEVRVFAPDGAWLRTLGGPGEGPGELNVPVGMALAPDGHLWVLNWRNARYTAYDPDSGAVIAEPRRRVSFVSIPWPGIVDDRGRIVDVGLDIEGRPAGLVLDSAFTPADTLSLPRTSDDDRIAFVADGVIMMTMADPFAPVPQWAPHPGGGIFAGDGSAFELHRVMPSGDTVRTVRLNRPPVPVSAAERDSALAAFEDMKEELGGAQPTREPRVAATRPAHGALTVDDDGRLWVRAPSAPGRVESFEVFDTEGRHIGTVPLPPGFRGRPAIRGDRMAVAVESDGIPQVVVYRIEGLLGDG